MDRHAIPTARWRAFTSVDEAKSFIERYSIFWVHCSLVSWCNIARLEVLAVVFLGFQVLRDVMLCYWVSGSQCFEGHNAFIFMGQAVVFDVLKKMLFFVSLWTTVPTTQCHTLEDLHPYLDMPVDFSGHTVIMGVLSLVASMVGSWVWSPFGAWMYVCIFCVFWLSSAGRGTAVGFEVLPTVWKGCIISEISSEL